MAQLPTPKIKERVKVQILPSSEAQESVELDYRLMVPGNFTGTEPGTHKDGDGTLKERRIREIRKKGDLKNILEDLNPKLKFTVPNKLSEDKDTEIEVNLNIKDIHT